MGLWQHTRGHSRPQPPVRLSNCAAVLGHQPATRHAGFTNPPIGLFDATQAAPATVEGHTLDCQVCRYGLFWHRRAQLHGGVATFFGLEWASPSADCYVCAVRYIHWFLPLTS